MTGLALALALASGAALEAERGDARCVYVLSYVGVRGDATARADTDAGVLYFLGRLTGRNPAIDVDVAVRTAGDSAKAAGVDPRRELQRCVAELRATGSVTSRIRARIGPGTANRSGI